MAFTDGKDGSKGLIKRVASSFSMRKKKNNATNTGGPKVLPRSKSTGSTTNYESMKLQKKISDVTNKTRIIKSSSAASVTQQPRREKIDDRSGSKKFVKWRSFDDSDSIWLSSDCGSPTSLLEERRLSVSFRFSVDENVVSWLSNVANSLNQQEANSIKDRPRIPKNNAESIQKKALKEDLTMQGRKVSFSEQSSGTKLESENPSPPLVQEKKSPEIVESKKSISKVVEPLFWPFEQRFDWTPEDILKHFTMSPRRKKLLNAKVSAGTSSPRSMRSQLLQTRKTDLKDGSKRKLVFNGNVTNASKIPVLKRTTSNNKKNNESTKNEPIRNCVKRNKSLPSRLRKSSKVVPIQEPAEVEEVIAAEKDKEEITRRKLINRRSKTMLEEDFALMNDFSIENAVGLGEFKGREGIVDSEFNSDTFLFDGSL